MQSMFEDATSFNQDISSWNVSNVENMDDMFYSATSFNQSLESWSVPRLILFGAANSKLTKLFTLPSTLTDLDVTNCQLTTLPELHPGLTIYCDGNPFDQITHRQLYKFYHGTEASPHYPAASPPGIPLSTSVEATRRLIMKYGEQTTAIVQDAVHDKSEIRYLMSMIHNMYQKIKIMEGLGIIHAHDYEMLTGLYNHCKINLYKVSLTFDNDKYAKLSNDVKKVMDSQPQPYEMYKLSMNNKTYFKEAFDITKDIGTILIHMRNFYQQFKLINDSVERILKHYEGRDPHGEKVDLPHIPDIPIPEYGILKYPINRQIAEQLLGVSKGISSYDIALQQHTKKIGTYKDVNGTQRTMYDDPYMRFNVLCIGEAGRLLYQGVERDDDEWQRVTLGGKHRKTKRRKTKRRKTKRSTRKRLFK
jgi:surface protein